MSSHPERYYRFGSVVLRLISPAFPETGQLARFSVPPQPPELMVRIHPVGELPLPAGEPRREPGAVWYRTDRGEAVVVENPAGEPLWVARYDASGSAEAYFRTGSGVPLTTFVVTEIVDLPRLLLRKGALVLHASFIGVGGRAVLFTAKKQTGKSTQAALWQRVAGAAVVNGDRAMIERRNGVYYACGLPYAGTSGVCLQGEYPLAAVVILSQGKQNVVRRASPAEAVRALLEGCFVDRASESLMSAFLRVAGEVASDVPFYAFRCLPDESAVACLRKALGFPDDLR